jgi:hypothetical protein
MQGGGQFHTMHGAAGMDAIQQRAHDDMDAARRASRTRRHQARHRGGHVGWLHLGRRAHGAEHGPQSATAEQAGARVSNGPGRGEGHGY